MLPQLDLSRSVVPVDADVCLDEPADAGFPGGRALTHKVRYSAGAGGATAAYHAAV
jgi:hypothetical protein